RWLLRAMMLGIASTSVLVIGQSAGDSRDSFVQPRSAGWLVQGRDGTLLVASGAPIHQDPGLIDKVGSALVGLGASAPGFESAALSLTRFTPEGAPDARFGSSG